MTKQCEYIDHKYLKDGSYTLGCKATEAECPKVRLKRKLGQRCFQVRV